MAALQDRALEVFLPFGILSKFLSWSCVNICEIKSLEFKTSTF